MRTLAAVVVATITSCSIYGESSPTSDGSPPPPPAGADGGADGDVDGGTIDWGSNHTDGGDTATDAATDAPTDGTTDTSTHVPANGDFEIPVCEGWIVGGSSTTLTDEKVAVHGGAHACKLCGSGTIWGMGEEGTYDAKAGDALASTAWVRAESGTAPISIGVTVDGSVQNGNIVTVGATYTELQSPGITAQKDGPVKVRLDVYSGGTTCIIVDDASITVTPPN